MSGDTDKLAQIEMFWKSDAALISGVKMARDVLALVEIAKAAREAMDVHADCIGMQGPAFQALRAALSALDGAQGVTRFCDSQ